MKSNKKTPAKRRQAERGSEKKYKLLIEKFKAKKVIRYSMSGSFEKMI